MPLRAEFPLSTPWPSLGAPGKGHARRRQQADGAAPAAALATRAGECGPCATQPGVGALGSHLLPRRRSRVTIPDAAGTMRTPLDLSRAPSPAVSGQHPGTPVPTSSRSPMPDPRIPAALPEPLVHYLRLRLVPRSRNAPL